MVLGDDLHSEMIFFHLDVWTVAHCLHQPALDLCTRVISMMQNTELGMSALTMQVEGAIVLLVEVHTPLHQFLDLCGCLTHHLLHGLAVRDIVACDDGIGDMFVEGIHLHVRHTGHTALGKACIRLVERSFADHTHLTLLGTRHFQGIAHTGHTSSDNQKVVLV